MKTIASPKVALQLLEQREHLRLHHHVERGRRLVGDQEARVARERHRDHHPLALPAGELVRVVVGPARRGARPARAARRPRACAPRLRTVVQLDRPRRSATDPCTGFSACIAPWNTIAASVQRTARSRPGFIVEHVLAVEQHLAVDRRARRQQPQERRRPGSTSRSPTRRRARASRRRRGRS